MGHDLFHLVYASCATIDFDSHENEAIRRIAVRRNAQRNITGFLHRHAGAFVQYVEGPQAAIGTLLGELRRDWRHENIEVLADGRIAERIFPNWYMEFSRTADGTEFEQKQIGSEYDGFRFAMLDAALIYLREHDCVDA